MSRWSDDELEDSIRANLATDFSLEYTSNEDAGSPRVFDSFEDEVNIGPGHFEALVAQNPIKHVVRERPFDTSINACLERLELLNDLCPPSHIENGIYISK